MKVGGRLGGAYLRNSIVEDMMRDGYERQDNSDKYEALQGAYSKHFESLKASMMAIQEDQEFKNAVQAHAQRLGIEMPRLDVSALTGEICKDWPKVKGFMNFAISLGAIWPGISAIATGAKAVIAMFDTTVIPEICKV